jgi:hypothetical protein
MSFRSDITTPILLMMSREIELLVIISFRMDNEFLFNSLIDAEWSFRLLENETC